ncbi:Cell division protein FtsQ [Commensalibacter sp. Nvir]|uniref:cell division protein FtsQ/DivIB n=1 Tax=Commensalibacter sp. Nvir TaxID=3069817 RepID=UPI002D3EFB4A|nr:Cell division protein FtsQ [Commensalibacter sp. Nvir]
MSYLNKPSDYQNDRPSKASITFRRLKRLAKPFILLVFIIILLGGGEWFIYKTFSPKDYITIENKIASLIPMKISEIEITGCKLTPEQEVKNALGMPMGKSIFTFSINNAQKRLNELPFVDHALVKRQLPKTIIVNIVERRPYAIWQNQGKFMLIDHEGKIVNDQGMSGKDEQAFLKLPLVVGVGANKAASDLLDDLASQPEIQKRVVAAVRVRERRWNLDLKNGIIIRLPENQELPALQRLTTLQEQIQLLDRPIQVVDLRLSDRLIIQENKNSLHTPRDETPDLAHTP